MVIKTKTSNVHADIQYVFGFYFLDGQQNVDSSSDAEQMADKCPGWKQRST